MSKRPCHQYPSGFYAQSNHLPPPVPPLPPPPSQRTYPHGSGSHLAQFRQAPYSYGNQQKGPPRSATFSPHNRLQQRLGPSSHHHRHSNQHKQQHQQPSVPAAPQEMFICRSCHNLELDSAAALQSHIRSHVPCQQCNFTASPHIVKAHFDVVHSDKYKSDTNNCSSGFKTVTVAVKGCRVQHFRICVGNRPEEIQQWIAERRRRFPRQKQAAVEAAVMAPTNTVPVKTVDSSTTKTTGLASLLEGYGSSSSSDEEESVNCTSQQVKEEINGSVQGALPHNAEENLSATIESSGAEAAGDTGALPYRTRLCRFFSRSGKCRNGDNCRFIHEMVRLNDRDTSSKRQKISATNNNNNGNQSKSLLAKLLASDVHRETILTLQLLEYIVDNDFLQNDPSNAEK